MRNPQPQVQTKHAKKLSLKKFGAPHPPPPKFFMFSLFRGEKRPQTERICGVRGLLEGGSGRGVSGEMFFVYALFPGPDIPSLSSLDIKRHKTS